MIQSCTAKIQDLMEFTKICEGGGYQEPQWQDLYLILPHSYIPQSIQFTVVLQKIQIYADVMFRKVFYTLLDNSIKYGERVSLISVSTLVSDDTLTIIWEDNGDGIPADEKEHIFEQRFGKNTGFGLFFTKKILSQTNISIRETGIEGKGARFEITVPKGKWKIDHSKFRREQRLTILT